MMTLKKKTKKQIKRYMKDVMAQTLNPGFALGVAGSVAEGFHKGSMTKEEKLIDEAADITMALLDFLEEKAHMTLSDEFIENAMRGVNILEVFIRKGNYEQMEYSWKVMTIFALICRSNGINEEKEKELLKICVS